jgi:glycerophosphoryl diester phosphodiesterase
MIIVAHRGLHQIHGENTIPAFVAAAQLKIPWIECDVWPSGDGIPMVIHDQTIDRTTTGGGLVAGHSSQQLQRLGVPTLNQLMDSLADFATGLMIEIKPPGAAGFCGEVRRMIEPYPGPWMLQSFHPENIQATNRTAILVENVQSLRQAIGGGWLSVHAEHSLIDRQIVEQLHQSNRKIGAWTVNTAQEIRRMVELGVDVLITDEPELASGMLE